MRRLGKNNHLQSMERVNLHYRMHKSGKKWVFTMLFGLAMSTGLVSVNVPAHAHADTVNSEYTAVTKTSTDSGGLATKATTDTISVHYYILNADGSFELIQDNSGSYSTNLTGPTGDNVTKDITPLKIDGYDFVTYTDGPKQGNDIVFTGDIIYGDQGDIWLLYVPKGATSLLPEDPDSDGLTNSEENDIGTNPTNPDTDSDGKDDGEDEDPLTPAETASADLTINYVDVDNNNEIVYSEIDADHKVGGVVSYQPKLTAKELANYVFVDGEDTLRSVTMDADGETITVKVKQNDHVITQQTQTWYVAYEGLDDSIVPDSAKQTITWTVDTNVTTGEKTYSTDDKFTSVDSPVIAGYTADQASVAAPEIGSTPDEDSYATVTYTKDVDPDDPDSDGLTSEEESEAGTDPDNPDTDSDGVNDSDDVKPLDPTISDDKDDPDSDNLTSEEESEAGTDPDNSDTDGDGVNDSDDVKPLDPTISDDKDDPDSDNLTSEEESEAGTDPDNSDTDSD
ncbi:KxYKxGKxW signal peptide domain-containing protein, partial [Lapidilactobacillus mulanensis]